MSSSVGTAGTGERTLIRGGIVITMEPGAADEVADILIEGDRIAAVGRDLPVAEGSARILDATDHIVIPGFIDTHRHLYQILVRGLASNWSLMQYLTVMISKLGPGFTPDDVFLGNRLGCLDAIDTGVTAVFDWCQESISPEHVDALLAGIESASLRTCFGAGANIVDWQDCLAPPFISSLPIDADSVRRLRDRYPSDTGPVTIGLAGRGPDHTTMEVVGQDVALTRELGIRLNLHHGQGLMPGGSSIRGMHEAGLLGDNLTIGPSSATALATVHEGGTRLEVWSHSQGVHVLRRELAKALDLPVEQVSVRHVQGAGCYGHNGADDAAMDAAMLALAVPGRPVQVVWSREDELGWAPYGPAAVVRVAADLDADGGVLSWRHEIWGNGHLGRPGSTPTLGFLAASHRKGGRPIRTAPEIPIEIGGAAGRNAVPGYAFPAHQVINHDLREIPLRTSALRSLGAHLNVFAAESFLDELAVAAGRDPVEYRLAHLDDPRARAVVQVAARRAGWTGWSGSDSVGHGIGYARYKNSSAYCAVVAEVEAVEEVRVRRLVIAVDAGVIVSPDGAENQIEGGAIQATSWTLKERVRFDRFTVTSQDWESYPILRFSEVPAVEVELLPGNGNPPLGVGEAAQGPTAAAIANAVYDALAVRVRALPLTPEQIVAAMPD